MRCGSKTRYVLENGRPLGALGFRTVVASCNRYNKVRRPQLGKENSHSAKVMSLCVEVAALPHHGFCSIELYWRFHRLICAGTANLKHVERHSPAAKNAAPTRAHRGNCLPILQTSVPKLKKLKCEGRGWPQSSLI